VTPEQRVVLEALKDRANRANGGMVAVELAGWWFQLDHNAPPLRQGWHLSVSLQPAGRSSTDEDWRFLGRAVSVLGAPDFENNLLTPIDTTPPNAPHHWHWDAPPEVIRVMRDVLQRLNASRRPS